MGVTPQVGLSLGTDAWTAENIPLQNELVEIAQRHGVGTLDTARVYVREQTFPHMARLGANTA